MKTNAQDVFTALYEVFHKLDKLKGPEEPDLTANRIEIEVYKERLRAAQKEVEDVLLEGSKLLDKYVDGRVKKVIAKMKYDGELK